MPCSLHVSTAVQQPPVICAPFPESRSSSEGDAMSSENGKGQGQHPMKWNTRCMLNNPSTQPPQLPVFASAPVLAPRNSICRFATKLDVQEDRIVCEVTAYAISVKRPFKKLVRWSTRSIGVISMSSIRYPEVDTLRRGKNRRIYQCREVLSCQGRIEERRLKEIWRDGGRKGIE